MLYDPKWEIETKVDPFSLPAFIAWLETKPSAQEYSYNDCNGGCLIGQYFKHHSISWDEFFCSRDVADLRLISAGSPHTFGGALERARNWQG